MKAKRKNRAAASLSRMAHDSMTPEARKERGRLAAAARWHKAKPEPPAAPPQPIKWYGLFEQGHATDTPKLIAYSRDKEELRQRARTEGRAWLVEQLDYDPSRTELVFEFAPAVGVQVPPKTVEALQVVLDADGKGDRS